MISSKQHHEAHVTWLPDQPGKFRGILALRVNGRFPAQVSVVGEALSLCGDGAKANRSDGRAFGKQVEKCPSVGTNGGDVLPRRRASLAREEPRGLARSAPVGGLCLRVLSAGVMLEDDLRVLRSQILAATLIQRLHSKNIPGTGKPERVSWRMNCRIKIPALVTGET